MYLFDLAFRFVRHSKAVADERGDGKGFETRAGKQEIVVFLQTKISVYVYYKRV